ncbi:uncharacterized protein T551_00893 [Pneumocystis jirovecii RU7]|uniref:Sm domain-containing protein n=1 Tax=Pneumocystis jirovecii (strain RU7) TaxID=1408657 RepID=A0A0W4ZV41_PNEJ7|nr:uncharacterized protein T551_00893 [Pneumocystis jirovecii RU7]KTW32211.1 hypothetical protein T551_00893 [Pneumocystis jirovecii RU7]
MKGKQILESWLLKTVRITLSDFRVFTGKLICIDNEGTVILSGTQEVNKGKKRSIGLVVLPGKNIIQFEIHAEETII